MYEYLCIFIPCLSRECSNRPGLKNCANVIIINLLCFMLWFIIVYDNISNVLFIHHLIVYATFHLASDMLLHLSEMPWNWFTASLLFPISGSLTCWSTWAQSNMLICAGSCKTRGWALGDGPTANMHAKAGFIMFTNISFAPWPSSYVC